MVFAVLASVVCQLPFLAALTFRPQRFHDPSDQSLRHHRADANAIFVHSRDAEAILTGARHELTRSTTEMSVQQLSTALPQGCLVLNCG